MSNRFRLFMQHLTLVIFILQVDPSSASKYEKYSQLNHVLPTYENAITNPWPTVPDTGKLLKVGSKGKVILILRERLRRTNDLPPSHDQGGPLFDNDLVDAVKIFQWRHGLKVDGVVGRATLVQMNIPPEARANQIIMNMQRWMDLSQKQDDRYILVNIPEYRLHLIENNQEVLSMKVIVGRPTRPSPELYSKITRIIFNPYWDVPDLIANNDIVPKTIANPAYLQDEDIRIFNTEDGSGREINPADINWQDAQENGFRYHFRQEPGIKNSLGLVKFEFNNLHNIYLHDTPAKDLFDLENRDFSSGCIRLEKPFDLVNYLMKDTENLTGDRVNDILESGKTTYIKIEHPLPIYITYITAWVDEKGTVHFRDDIYQRDLPPEQETIMQMAHEQSLN